MNVIESLRTDAYTVPLPAPERDGTLEWSQTTLVTVGLAAGNKTGLVYTYGPAAVCLLIKDELEPLVTGRAASEVETVNDACRDALRNAGTTGLSAFAVSAVDMAMWDLWARLLKTPLAAVFGRKDRRVPAYASGGFLSTSAVDLDREIALYTDNGFKHIKIKVGGNIDEDEERIARVRSVAGPEAQLMVDANGAWHTDEALAFAHAIAEHGVTWFEEPVSSDHEEAISVVANHLPAGMALAAGEYVTDPFGARRLLEAGVDVLQLDATRCGGYTGFRRIAGLAAAYGTPLSSHCAASIHRPVAAATPTVRHSEYFLDHARVETALLSGAVTPTDGFLPRSSASGHGLSLNRDAAEPYCVTRDSVQ